MAKRAHPKRKKQPPAAPPPASGPKPPPIGPSEAKRSRGASPWSRFWLLDISWAKWLTFRFTFFTLLAIDAFLQLAHAPRYGAGGFNVQHLPFAPLPEPGRPSINFAHGALCLLFALIAQGVLVRVTLPLAATLYGWAYFSSQLDSFQHHYLMWLVIVVACFVPHRPDPLPPGAAATAPRRLTSWAVRLLLVQVAIVYLWAAISKLTPLWLDGSVLFIQIADGNLRDLVTALGFDHVAKLVLLSELALAAAVWWRPAWLPALVVGVGLHVGVELVGFEIGLFSYLMIAIYLLVIPDRVYFAAAARFPAPRIPALAGWVLAPLALVAVLVLVPLPFGAALALAAVLLIAAFVRDRRALAGWAFVVAAVIPIAVDATTDEAADYYRYWAGAARRMGDQAEARRAYLGLIEVDPDSEYAHFHLGNLDASAGNLDAAASHYVRAQRGAGKGRTRAFAAEAQVRLRQNDPERARAALEHALRVDPADGEARAMLTQLGGTPSPSPSPSTAPTAPPADDQDD